MKTRAQIIQLTLSRYDSWFTVTTFLIVILFNLLARASDAQNAICARVRIEIPQELTLERQAFEARMTIHNGVPGIPLENIGVNVLFFDVNGSPVLASSDPNNVTAKFFIRLQTGSSIPSSVPGENSARITWLIIPSPGAGGATPQGQMYSVGAALRYRAGGQDYEISVSPDTIWVKPMPLLSIYYFLPREVYGDEPFTPTVEPPVPYTLGIRVGNTGSGLARNVRIESGQPTIVENQQGLLVDFRIAGTEVNGLPASSSLLCNFGDIQANRAGIGRWIMTSSLSGRFTEFSAYYTHADDLGGKLTSLINGTPRTRVLVWNVLVDLAGRDNIRDFLALDGNTLSVYESENVDTLVSDQSSNALLSSQAGAITLTPQPITGFLYIQKPDPFEGRKIVTHARRADGKTLNSANAWFSKTFDYEAKKWLSYVNIFDVNNTAGLSYTLTLSAVPGLTNRPPVLDPMPNRSMTVGATYSFIIGASDLDGDSLQFTSPEAAAAGATINSTSGLFTWTPSESQVGTKQFTVIVTDNGQPPLTATGTLTVIVTSATNQGPVIQLSREHVWYVDGTGPVLLDAAAEVEAPETSKFSGGNLSVAIIEGGVTGDQLLIADQTGTETNVTVTSASEVKFGTEVVGLLEIETVGTNLLMVVFNTNASLPVVEAVLRQVAFDTTAPSQTSADRLFEYVLTDADGRASLPVSLDLGRTTSNENTITVTRGPNGSLRFALRGVPNRVYTLQRSENLRDWEDVGTVTAQASGLVQFSDALVSELYLFYRLKFP